PEYWRGMEKLIPPLAEAGYRVWVPDQRGYNLSDKPRGIAAYQMDTLAADIVGLIKATGQEKAVVIGHDWGGAIAWWLAIHHPTLLEKLIILNIPHPQIAGKQLLTDPSQVLRSSYAFFFQLPWLPEFLSRLNNWALPIRTMRLTSRSGAFSETEMEGYRQAWS